MVRISLACTPRHLLTLVPYFCRQRYGRTWRKMQLFPMAETNLSSLTAAAKRKHYLSLFLAILFLPTRPQGINHSSPKAKRGAWASSPATPCCHPANNRLGVPHPLPAPAPRSLPASGWLAGQRCAGPSWGLLLARSVPTMLKLKEFIWFLSSSKPQGCAFSLCGGNAEHKTGFSSANDCNLLLLQRQATKPGPLLVAEGPSHDTHGEDRGRHGGHCWTRRKAYRAPGLRPSRRLREDPAANIFEALVPRQGRHAGRCETALRASGLRCHPGRARRSSAGVRLAPGAAPVPVAALGGTHTAEARPRRRDRDRPKSSSAAGRAARDGAGGGRHRGLSREARGPRSPPPPAAGRNGSTCSNNAPAFRLPGPAGPNQRPADPPPLLLCSQKGEQNPARFCSPRA